MDCWRNGSHAAGVNDGTFASATKVGFALYNASPYLNTYVDCFSVFGPNSKLAVGSSLTFPNAVVTPGNYVMLDTTSPHYSVEFDQTTQGPTSNGQGWSIFEICKRAPNVDVGLRYQKGANGQEADYFSIQNFGQQVQGNGGDQGLGRFRMTWQPSSNRGSWLIEKSTDHGATWGTVYSQSPNAPDNDINTKVLLATGAGVTIGNFKLTALA